jgi:hypothetical protein
MVGRAGQNPPAPSALQVSESTSPETRRFRRPTYRGEEVGNERVEFRAEWARLIRDESKRYTEPVGDDAHCQAILGNG